MMISSTCRTSGWGAALSWLIGKEGPRTYGMQNLLAPESLFSSDYSSRRGQKRALCAQNKTALPLHEVKIESLALGLTPPAPWVLPSTEWSRLSQ